MLYLMILGRKKSSKIFDFFLLMNFFDNFQKVAFETFFNELELPQRLVLIQKIQQGLNILSKHSQRFAILVSKRIPDRFTHNEDMVTPKMLLFWDFSPKKYTEKVDFGIFKIIKAASHNVLGTHLTPLLRLLQCM